MRNPWHIAAGFPRHGSCTISTRAQAEVSRLAVRSFHEFSRKKFCGTSFCVGLDALPEMGQSLCVGAPPEAKATKREAHTHHLLLAFEGLQSWPSLEKTHL